MPRLPRSVFVSKPGGNMCCGGISRSVVREDWEIVHRKRIADIEDEDPVIPEIEFRSTPDRLLTAPPIRRWRVGFVAPTPLRWDIKRLQRFDVERRSRRRRKSNNSLPQSVESQVKLDLLAPHHRANNPHRPFAAGAKQRILAPHLHDEVAPQRSQSAGAFCFGSGKREKCRITRNRTGGFGKFP